MTAATPPPEGETGTGRRAPFPHHYEIALSGAGPGVTLGAGLRPTIEGGAPDTFGGRDDWWSPEHLLLASLGLCLKTTFDAFAAKDKLDVRAYASRARGVLDKTPAGLVFTSLVVEVDLEVAADTARAERVLEAAKHWCIVSNALKAPVEVSVNVRGV
jgi:organic hydroperoxide reductase OsmC/OhrA